MERADSWLNAIDPSLLQRIDYLLCTGRLIHAIVVLREEGGQYPCPACTRRRICWSSDASHSTGRVCLRRRGSGR